MTRPTIIALIASCAMFMENLDSTVIATALPAIARSFGRLPTDLGLGMTAYLISLAVFIPVSGWIADRYGARRTFCAAIAIFAVASVFCGLAQALIPFVAARFLQGLGGAMMVPVGRLSLIRSVEKSAYVSAFAWMMLPPVFAPLLGAPLGGFITTYLSWRWVFLLNVPIAMAGIGLGLAYFPDDRGEERRALDWPGFLIFGGAIGALVLGLETSAATDADLRWGLALCGAGVALGFLGALRSARIAHPLVDFSLLRIPTYTASAVNGAAFRVAAGAMPFVLPLTLQVGLGMSAFQSGLLTLSSGIGALTMKSVAPGILRRFGFRNLLLVNGIVSAVSLYLCVFIRPGTPTWLIALLLVSGGFFRSLQFTALMAITWADVPAGKTGEATSLFGMLQQVSFSAGIALGALLLRIGAMVHPAGSATPESFRFAFAGIGALALVHALSYLRLAPEAGAEVSGRVQPSAAE